MKVVLDTHILLWWVDAKRKLSRGQARLLSRVSAENPAMVSDISLWEIAMLHKMGRISFSLPIREALEMMVAPPLVVRCGISPAIAAAVAELPDSFQRDPADRIIVCTAMLHGATLLTSDRKILDAALVRCQA